MKSPHRDSPQDLRQPAGVKRPYVTPRLVELGSVEELTRGAQGTSPDGAPFRFKG